MRAMFNFLRRRWESLAFVLGFVNDLIFLNKIDSKIDNLILLSYVVLASVSILLFYAGVADKMFSGLNNLCKKWMPLLMQFAFGGLLSGMLIFYGRSGDILVSAPFLATIAALMILNEIVDKQSSRLVYNLAVYFVGLFSYCVLVVPVFIADMGDIIFIGSGLLALFIFYLVFRLLRKIIPKFLSLNKRSLVFVIGCIYVAFNGLYFSNLIPPIPLSLTELGIYQSVEKTSNGNYRIVRENKEWWEKLIPQEQVFRPLSGDGVYCFARVYAPTKLTTDISHRWEYFSDSKGWQPFGEPISYRITGENKNGYRGYTTISNFSNGKWRCTVENNRGQILGRKVFTIDSAKAPANLVTIVE